MTDLDTLQNQLMDLATTRDADRTALASLSLQLLTAGASIGTLSGILASHGWRFALTRCGEKLDVVPERELRERYGQQLKELAERRDETHDENWHEHIAAEVHYFIETDTEIGRYLRSSEGFGDVNDAIDAIFAGTGARFNGEIILFDRRIPPRRGTTMKQEHRFS